MTAKPKKVKKTPQRTHSTFFLNGVKQEVFGDENFQMLANWLRRERELTGTKIVCAEGDCGACTVQQAFPHARNFSGFQAVNSCIKLVGQMDGSSLVTIEGIQNGVVLSPVQEAMKSCHGSQCGYCTPGFVMAMASVIEEKKSLTAKQAMNCLTGNLCRCTGYQPIIEAAATATYSAPHSLASRYLSKDLRQILAKTAKSTLRIDTGTKIFFAPASLKEALRFLNKYKKGPAVRIVSSATDLGVQYNKGRPIPDLLLSLHLIPDLQAVTKTAGRITVGARVTLTELRHSILDTNPEFAMMLNVFASPQIKNTATLVGNVANGSPIGDTMPYLMIADAFVHTAALSGSKITRRKIPLTEFYLGYRTLALQPGELITAVSFATNEKDTLTKIYKAAARKDLDISAVCGAFQWDLKQDKNGLPVITKARIALGGVAATTIRCAQTEAFLAGKPLTLETIDTAAEHLSRAIRPLDDLRGSAAYRHVLAKNMLKRFGQEALRPETTGSV